MVGSFFAVLAAASALGSAGGSDAVSRILDSLVGTWAIVDTTAGKQSKGHETWSAAIPGQMYLERYDAGVGASRTIGTAAIWQVSANWRGVWCTRPQGCIPLRVEVRGKKLIVWADENAPAEFQPITERFWLRSGNRLEQVLEACSAPAVCQRMTTVAGTRQ